MAQRYSKNEERSGRGILEVDATGEIQIFSEAEEVVKFREVKGGKSVADRCGQMISFRVKIKKENGKGEGWVCSGFNNCTRFMVEDGQICGVTAIKTTPLYTSDYDLEGFGTPKFLPSGRIPKFTGAGPNPPVIRRQSKIRKWVQRFKLIHVATAQITAAFGPVHAGADVMAAWYFGGHFVRGYLGLHAIGNQIANNPGLVTTEVDVQIPAGGFVNILCEIDSISQGRIIAAELTNRAPLPQMLVVEESLI